MMSLLTLAPAARADFIVPTIAGGYAWNRPTVTGTAATFQAWDTFTTPAGPNAAQSVMGAGTGDPATMSTGLANLLKGYGGDSAASWTTVNSGGTPNVFDTSAPDNGAFITSGGNIYSFSAAVTPRIEIPNNIDGVAGNNPDGTTTLLFQLRTQGSTPDLSQLLLTDPISGTIVPATSVVVLGSTPAGMGGTITDRLLTFTVPGNADLYTFNFNTGGSSVSLDRIAIDTYWNPVPEPACLGLALLFVTAVRGRRTIKHVMTPGALVMRTLLCALLLTCTAQAHFVFVVPTADGVRVVFSETLETDDAVTVEKLTGLALTARSADGKDVPLTLTAGKHDFTSTLAEVPHRVHGSVAYGVMKRGEGKPYLLQYHAKTLWPGCVATYAMLGETASAEIVPTFAEGRTTLTVLANGKPVPNAEINLVDSDGKKEKVKANDQGVTAPLALKGCFGAWVKIIEAKSGETPDRQKYEEIRHYATLVAEASEAKTTAALPPLPEGFSSFGAITEGGHVYVYGGHAAKTHSYSTETTLGKFRRLNLAKPERWEELEAGVACQGLTLVAHKGKLYRLGGMRPRNAPGEMPDQVSLASCQVYDIAAKTWLALPNLPAGRSSFDAVVVKDTIYAFGGWAMAGAGKESIWATTGLKLDLTQTPVKWETIPQPFVRRALTTVAAEGKVYVVGGLNADGETERTVDIFDTTTKSWSSGPKLPEPDRNGFSAATCTANGHVYANTADGTIWRLNVEGNVWESAGRVAVPRIVHRMLDASAGRVIVLGGATRKENVAAVELLPLSTTTAVSGQRP
jgi:hypothetical protein